MLRKALILILTPEVAAVLLHVTLTAFEINLLLMIPKA